MAMMRPAAIVLTAALLLAASPGPGAASLSAFGWVYLRGGEVPAPNESLVEVLAVGDVMTGRGMEDVRGIFANVAGELRAADLTIGNLEGALSPTRVADDSMYLLLPLSTPATLAEAGFDLVGIANNHALDAGLAGRAETRRLLREGGLEPVEGTAAVREIDGMRLAFLAWNDLGAPHKEPFLEAVRQTRAEADVVIVMVHWGREYQRHPSLPQRDLAGALLNAGADVVVGSHPHVVQDVRVVEPAQASDRTRLVAFSLGNFVFDQGWGDTGQGLGLRLLFDAGGLRAAQVLPLSTAPRPRWIDPESATDLLARIVPPDRLGFFCVEDTCEQVDVPRLTRSGVFGSGAIDLTGDGVPEILRRHKGVVEIFEGDRSVWQTAAEWQVRDVALGDPNDDGRYEAVLAVDSARGSQPFVIGHRGGMYRDLWGGSPVSDPILEVEIADLDGDSVQELAAIESAANGSGRYLTVWRWHGWGFSLVWRSLPGEYRDLIVLPAEDGMPARLSVGVR